MPRHAACALAVALALAALAPVGAHHSRARFVLDETMPLEGVVTRVDWRNPHMFIHVTAASAEGEPQDWVIEGHSLAGARRLGWSRDTIEEGDRGLFVVSPNIAAQERLVLLDHVTLETGERYYGFRIPEGADGQETPDRSATAPSTDFSGTWGYVRSFEDRLRGAFDPPTDWSLTPAGEAQVAAFDLHDSPGLNCIGVGLPRYIVGPYGHRWAREGDVITITRELLGTVRTIHIDGPETPPDDFVADRFGWSVGRFESERTLLIETSHAKPFTWGLAPGLDSSPAMAMTERYELDEDGYGMSFTFTLEDPAYLAAPVTRAGRYQKLADYPFDETPCDEATAQLHLQFE